MMLRSMARYGASATLTAFVIAAAAFSGCGRGADLVVAELEAGPRSFGLPDAATGEGGALVTYCPSNQCPAGFTTCSDSRFPCDVDVLSDDLNCGECDRRCREGRCVDGKCVVVCDMGELDCDGIPDNGCETNGVSNENCGGCGIVCPDPDKPCMTAGIPQCGCSSGRTLCRIPPNQKIACVNTQSDDKHCGECLNACDPAGNGRPPPPPNSYYGCVEGQCDRLRCEEGYLDCNGDLNQPGSDGCETSIWDRENCGACGNRCEPDQACQGNEVGSPMCACPSGQTYCPEVCLFGSSHCQKGTCVDLGSDRSHCGACGRVCISRINTKDSVASCSYGTCVLECLQGRADCNGNPADDCEVNTASDPQNCGGCGKVCDAVAGQACVHGRCVVEPCEDGEREGGAPQ